MVETVIHAALLARGDRLEGPGWVAVESGRIHSVGLADEPPPEAALVVEHRGSLLAPGFIDLHIHGSGEFFIEDGPGHLQGLCELLPAHGVTSFLPTIIPVPDEHAAARASWMASAPARGARVLGVFVEGPFLTRAGAACPLAQVADPAWIERMAAALSPHRVVFAVAPDFPGMESLVPLMASASGGPVFMAHTAATAAQTERAIDLGATHATHFYNVMPPPPVEAEPGVRACGFLEGVYARPGASVDFILDGEHVDPVAVRMALACKGVGKVCLITDANRGAGLPAGRHRAFGHEIEFRERGAPARFTSDHPTLPGALAGSGLTMDVAVRNAVRLLGVGIATAMRMASESPARVMGLGDRKGRLAPGLDADLVLLDPASLEPRSTWVLGRPAHPAPGATP
jgi:N-acetylglucosamine-6-phosphate deacetylase